MQPLQNNFKDIDCSFINSCFSDDYICSVICSYYIDPVPYFLADNMSMWNMHNMYLLFILVGVHPDLADILFQDVFFYASKAKRYGDGWNLDFIDDDDDEEEDDDVGLLVETILEFDVVAFGGLIFEHRQRVLQNYEKVTNAINELKTQIALSVVKNVKLNKEKGTSKSKSESKLQSCDGAEIHVTMDEWVGMHHQLCVAQRLLKTVKPISDEDVKKFQFVYKKAKTIYKHMTSMRNSNTGAHTFGFR